MNYKIYQFDNNLKNLVQQAINDGIPVYILPVLFRDIITQLTPMINQIIQEESLSENQMNNDSQNFTQVQENE